jgi:hypothetical protein
MSRACARLVALTALAAFALAVAGCGGSFGGAKSAYRKGRLAEAKAELVALEDDSRGWSPERRVEYALYRGLVHLSVGDRAVAGLWLRETKAFEDAHPGTLEEDDRARLKLALDALGENDGAPSSR